MNATMARIVAILDSAFIGYVIAGDVIRFRTRNSVAIDTAENTFSVYGGGQVIRLYNDPNGDAIVERLDYMLDNPMSYLFN